MKISDQLNLVSTLKDKNGNAAHVHIRPLSYEVVEENCVLLGNLFSQFFSLVGGVGAPRVAAMMLKKRLKQDRELMGDDGQPDLMDEMVRLSTVIYQDESGYKTTPLSTALSQELISLEDYRDIEGELVFFMVTSALQRSELMEVTVGKSLKMYSAQLTSSSASAFRDSLKVSTPDPDSQPEDAEEEKSSSAKVKKVSKNTSQSQSLIPS